MSDLKRHVMTNIITALDSLYSSAWTTNEKYCQSPIELGFMIAFAASRRIFTNVPFMLSGLDWTLERMIVEVGQRECILCGPQVTIGSYRVDFAIAYGNGRGRSECMVVECDGHDFHERTKEQASRDKERDRFLQAAGYPVFRFSGSDIYSNAWGCGCEIGNYIDKRMEAWRGSA